MDDSAAFRYEMVVPSEVTFSFSNMNKNLVSKTELMGLFYLQFVAWKETLAVQFYTHSINLSY